MDTTTALTGIAYGSIAYGVATAVAPRAVIRLYGLRDESGAMLYVGRMWASRTAVLGGLGLLADTDEQRERLLAATAAMNAFDTVAALLGAARHRLPRRAALMGAASSAAFAAVAVSALGKR